MKHIALLATTMAFALAPTAAYSENPKICSVDTVSTGRDHQTVTVIQGQTSACNSNSGTGFFIDTGPVKNKAGNIPPGQQ